MAASLPLRGRTAVITGASRGLGRALARRFAHEGMPLLLVARSFDRLEALRAELAAAGAQVQVLAADLARPDDRRRLIAVARATLGRIDVLVNNAAVIEPQDYAQVDAGFIEQSIALNLAAPLQLTRLALPDMLARDHGHIVNIASVAGLLPIGWAEVYTATKHGLVGFTRALRTSLTVMRSSVRTSLVCPGIIEDTGMYADRVAAHHRVPWLVGTSPSQRVVDAVVRCLQRGRGEVVIGAWPLRSLCAAYNLAAPVGDLLQRWAGTHQVFMTYAREQQAARRP